MAVRYPKRVSRPLESSRGPGYEIADQADYNLLIRVLGHDCGVSGDAGVRAARLHAPLPVVL